MLLMSDPTMRKPFHITDLASLKKQMNDALKTATKKLKQITSDMIVPPKALQIPRQILVDLDEPTTIETKLKHKSLKRNPLYALTDLSKVP